MKVNSIPIKGLFETPAHVPNVFSIDQIDLSLQNLGIIENDCDCLNAKKAVQKDITKDLRLQVSSPVRSGLVYIITN